MTTIDSDRAATLHREPHTHLPSDPALRVKTLESLAVESGLVAPESIDAWIEAYSEHIGPKRGAMVVAFQPVLRPSALGARLFISRDHHPWADTRVEAIAAGALAAPRVTTRWPTEAFPEGWLPSGTH